MNSPLTHAADNRTASRDPRWVGLLLILVPMLTRATTGTTVLPAWDVDPLTVSASPPGLGPAGSMLIDALVLLGAAMLFLAEARARRAVNALWLIALLIGAAAVALHGWWWPAIGSTAPHGSLGNQRIGAAWVSGLAAAVAILHAARDLATRRVVIGVLVAWVALLALRGVQQVVIEHPAVVSAFKADPAAALAARGWTPGSPMAQAYERRLLQPEATGWFGLSNVYASFAACGVAIAAAWLIGVLRARRDPSASRSDHQPSLALTVAFPTLALILSLAATSLAGSKGGYIVALIAITLAIIPSLARLPAFISRFASFLGPACIFSVLAAVAVRGVIGERIGELSILFRWFYMQASGRILALHPLTGVGPDGYQLAYLSSKNPLSPEEVSSPHSILLDWLSTLGVAGAAWALLLIGIAVLTGRSLLTPPLTPTLTPTPVSPSADNSSRQAARVGMLTLSFATIAAMWMESPYITPDLAAVRLIALGLGCAFVLAIAQAGPGLERSLTIGLAAAALALLAHAQIELTASNFASCGLCLLVLGAAAAPALPFTTLADEPARRPAAAAILAAILLALSAGLLSIRGIWPALKWERDLKQAANIVQPIGDITDRASTLSPATPQSQREAILRDLAAIVGRPVPSTSDGFNAAMMQADKKLLPPAAELLLRAQSLYPDEWRIGREASRLYLRLSAVAAAARDLPSAQQYHDAAARAMQPPDAVASTVVIANPPRTRAQALIWETIARQRGDTTGLTRAVELLTQTTQRDPFNMEVALRLFKLTRELGRADDARHWAVKTLELEKLARLDAGVKSLNDRDRSEVTAAARPTSP